MTLETVLAELLQQDWLPLDSRADGNKQLAAYLAPHIEQAVRRLLRGRVPDHLLETDVQCFTELLAERLGDKC